MKLVCRLVGLGDGDLGLPILLATDADCDRADRKWTMGGHAGGKRIHGETHRSVLTLSTDEPQLISDSVVWVEESSNEASVGS